MSQKPTGAGILCYYDNRKGVLTATSSYDNKILYLVLKDKKGKLDFPKGVIDDDETIYQCAIRETYEECNLDVFDFEEISENYITCGDGLCLFVGKIKDSVMLDLKNKIMIKRNPHSHIFEHESFEFLDREKAEQGLYEYLIEALKKSESFIQK